jgi:hypothetical protein
VDEHVDDPEWEGSEPWRHPLDPLAHKRQRKPKAVRFWHPVQDNAGIVIPFDPPREPEQFDRPGASPWWRR